MAVSIADHRKWVNEYLKDPEKRDLANAALDAFELLSEAQVISPQQILPIAMAAKCRFIQVCEIGTDLLTRLSSKHLSAQNVMREMLDSKKAGERFQVVAALNSRVPKPIALELILKAFHDKGNRVREKAAAKADLFGFSELLPQMHQALSVESHPSVKEALEFHITMLRDGYRIMQQKDYITLHVRLRHGWGSQIITQVDIDKGRIPLIVAEMRKHDFS